jgi:hypothetical protein
LLHSGISGIAHSSLIPNSQVRASVGDANVVISGYNMTSSVIGSISRDSEFVPSAALWLTVRARETQ